MSFSYTYPFLAKDIDSMPIIKDKTFANFTIIKRSCVIPITNYSHLSTTRKIVSLLELSIFLLFFLTSDEKSFGITSVGQ